MGHRTDNHVLRTFCTDIQASFARHRAALVAEAVELKLPVLIDDGVQFVAEGKSASGGYVWLHAGPQGSPFVNGPSINRRSGHGQYSQLFLPKRA